ncbi:uncharacterized protein RCO7_09238 [Rhynchosporium graminicola]|uniref:Uncharacterized protein n=1 Tax=Rhynchosporium graminicola TaxID=2792576 RepID=A0A1E1KYC4_9HELO|nr:uncharacterized protein RCO7_09238 [Rhynchosporium commune]
MSYYNSQNGFGQNAPLQPQTELSPEAQTFMDSRNFDPELFNPLPLSTAMIAASQAQAPAQKKRGREEEVSQEPGSLHKVTKRERSQSPRSTPRAIADSHIDQGASTEPVVTIGQINHDSSIQIGADVNPLLSTYSASSFDFLANPLNFQPSATPSKETSKAPKSSKRKGKERAAYASSYDHEYMPGHSGPTSAPKVETAPNGNNQSAAGQVIVSSSYSSSDVEGMDRVQQYPTAEGAETNLSMPCPTASFDDYNGNFVANGGISQEEQNGFQQGNRSQQDSYTYPSYNPFGLPIAATDTSCIDAQNFDLGHVIYGQSCLYTSEEVDLLLAEAKWKSDTEHDDEEDKIRNNASKWAQDEIDEYHRECEKSLQVEVEKGGLIMVGKAEALFAEKKAEWEQGDRKKDAQIQQLEHLLSQASNDQLLKIPSIPQIDQEMLKDLNDARGIADVLNYEKQKLLENAEALIRSFNCVNEKITLLLKKLEDAERKVRDLTNDNGKYTKSLSERGNELELLTKQKENAEKEILALQDRIDNTPKVHPDTEKMLQDFNVKVDSLESENKKIPELTEQLRQQESRVSLHQTLVDKIPDMSKELEETKAKLDQLHLATSKHTCPVAEPKILPSIPIVLQEFNHQEYTTHGSIGLPGVKSQNHFGLSDRYLLKNTKRELAKTNLALESYMDHVAFLEKDRTRMAKEIRKTNYALVYNVHDKNGPRNSSAKNSSAENMHSKKTINTRKHTLESTFLQKLFHGDDVAITARKLKVLSPDQVAVNAHIRELRDICVPSSKASSKGDSDSEPVAMLVRKRKPSSSATIAVNAATQEQSDPNVSPASKYFDLSLQSTVTGGPLPTKFIAISNEKRMKSSFKSLNEGATHKQKKRVAFKLPPVADGTPAIATPVAPVDAQAPIPSDIPNTPSKSPRPWYSDLFHPLVQTTLLIMTIIFVSMILITLKVLAPQRIVTPVPSYYHSIPDDWVITVEKFSDTLSITTYGPPDPVPAKDKYESEVDIGMVYFRAQEVIETMRLEDEQAEKVLRMVATLQPMPEPTPPPPATTTSSDPVAVESEPAEPAISSPNPHQTYPTVCDLTWELLRSIRGLFVICFVFWCWNRCAHIKEHIRLNNIEMVKVRQRHRERCERE